jgi:hypothetical protein
MEDTQLHYGDHVVGFLDVLGQRQQLRELRSVPPDQNCSAIIETLKKSAGYVLRLRDLLKTTSTSYTAGLSVGLCELIAKAQCGVVYRTVSDSIIMAARLRNDQRLASVASVHLCMTACCNMQVLALELNKPIRGGIDSGPGLELDPTEVYGAALERAVSLEKSAEYPRVLVGEELCNYLDRIESGPDASPTEKCAVKIASVCKTFITEDPSDHRKMLDFLGPPVASHLRAPLRQGGARKIEACIQQQLGQARDAGSAELVSRYERLSVYFESRSMHWTRG